MENENADQFAGSSNQLWNLIFHILMSIIQSRQKLCQAFSSGQPTNHKCTILIYIYEKRGCWRFPPHRHLYEPKSHIRWRQRKKKKAMNDQDTEGTCQQVTLSETVSFSLFYICKKNLEASAFLSRLFIVTVSFCSVLNSELTFTSWPIVYAHWVQNVALMDNWMKRRFQTKTNTFPTRKCRVIFSSPYSG